MMNEAKTNQQTAIIESVEAFAKQNLREQVNYCKETYKKAGDLGFTGILIPEEFGGMGLGGIKSICYAI